jgi:hypothetical protein
MEEWRYSFTIIDLALDGSEWTASRPGRFTPREIALSTHWIGSWVSPRADLNILEKRKILSLPGFKPYTLSPIAHHYTD